MKTTDNTSAAFWHRIACERKAQRDAALAALRDAADWLSRSTRIDDQEQAQDLRAAIAAAEKGQ